MIGEISNAFLTKNVPNGGRASGLAFSHRKIHANGVTQPAERTRPVHSECRPALKVWCASIEGTLASLQVSRAREKVSRASLEGTRASLQVSRAKEKVSRAKEKVSLATLRVRLATLWGSREGDGAAMKPVFAGFMAVEQS